jgi:hypothetical protein
MMKTIYAKHLLYDNGHLIPILDEMRHCGPPTLRCVKIADGVWMVLEGSHRVAAAFLHRMTPKLVVLQPEVEEYAPGRWSLKLKELPSYSFAEVAVLDLGVFDDQS